MRGWRCRFARWLFVAACLACGPAVAADAKVVATVLAVRGAVFTEDSGSLLPLSANASLHERDTVVAVEGKAKIALEDGTILSVGEHTRVYLGESSRESPSVRTRLGLVSGALRLLVARVAAAGSFEVATETAIAAVRGTDWLIESTPEQTAVALLSGKVSVSTRAQPSGATVVLALPGHGTDVRRGAVPTPPVPWGARRLADLLARATFN